MITITLKYTDYGSKETQEFREYTKNLIGYRHQAEYDIRFGVEHDPMFDDKIVCQMTIYDEDFAFDAVNHFMMDREINGENIPFDVDLSSIAIYVTGSDKIMNYLTSRSFSHLYERMEILESMVSGLSKEYQQLKQSHEKMAGFMQHVGVDKFPDIVRELIESMEFEGHQCKGKINEILQRKVH